MGTSQATEGLHLYVREPKGFPTNAARTASAPTSRAAFATCQHTPRGIAPTPGSDRAGRSPRRSTPHPASPRGDTPPPGPYRSAGITKQSLREGLDTTNKARYHKQSLKEGLCITSKARLRAVRTTVFFARTGAGFSTSERTIDRSR